MNWLVSLLIGTGVGVIYGLLGVRSPAPPIVALVGLLGMLGGEQITALARQHWAVPRSSTAQAPPSLRNELPF
jgi:XapX domain-containing protein